MDATLKGTITYPTLGKGKSSSKGPTKGYVPVPRRVVSFRDALFSGPNC